MSIVAQLTGPNVVNLDRVVCIKKVRLYCVMGLRHALLVPSILGLQGEGWGEGQDCARWEFGVSCTAEGATRARREPRPTHPPTFFSQASAAKL